MIIEKYYGYFNSKKIECHDSKIEELNRLAKATKNIRMYKKILSYT